MEYILKPMEKNHWEQAAAIYLEGIQTRIATFQDQVPDWESWDAGHVKTCRLVACHQGQVMGWAALSPTSSRCTYAGVAEVSIYIGAGFRGQKIGIRLLEKLIEDSEAAGFWTLQSGIISQNEASIKLHQKCGFREVGVREKLGRMSTGNWHDVVLMERRSNIVGID